MFIPSVATVLTLRRDWLHFRAGFGAPPRAGKTVHVPTEMCGWWQADSDVRSCDDDQLRRWFQ